MTKWIVLFAIAGCSIPTKHASSGDDDAMSDAGSGSGSGSGSAATTVVQLTVLSTSFDGMPDTGAIALFRDPAGATISDGLVDSAGHAQAELPNGGSVTVIRITDQSPTERDVAMTTITGVKPGDKLVAGSTLSPRAFPGNTTTMSVAFTPYAASYSYMFYTVCGGTGGSSGTATLYFYDACHGAKFDLVAVATSSDESDVRYVVVPDVTYAANGSITVPNTWSTTNGFVATLTNVPTGISSLALTHSTFLGESPSAPGDASAMSPAPGIVSLTAPYVPGIGSRSELELALHHDSASGFQTFSARIASTAGTQGLDLSQQSLPFIVGAISETPTTIAWDQLDSGTPDARFVTWSGHWSVGTRTDYINWTIEDAGTGTSLTLPGLPSKYGEYDPAQATGVALGHGGVEYVDYDRLNGYDDARAYGPNLVDTFDDLGVFVDMPVQRRVSRNALFL